jgi:hypothetical protein
VLERDTGGQHGAHVTAFTARPRASLRRVARSNSPTGAVSRLLIAAETFASSR